MCCACHAKWHRRSPSAAPATKNANHLLKATQKYCACHTERFSTRLQTREMEVPRLRCKTTLQPVLKPSTRREFCSFPHRHCDGTRKPATRDETCWCWSMKTSISCETSSNFTLRRFKIDVFLRVFLRIDLKIDPCEASVDSHRMSQNATPATEFAVPATQNDIGGLQSAAPARKKQRIFWKRSKTVIAPATQNHVWPVLKHVGMSRSAMPATRNKAKRRWKAPKGIPTAIRPSCGRCNPHADGCVRLRTVANGCERLRTVADGCERLRNV